jgi:hypothetical protein
MASTSIFQRGVSSMKALACFAIGVVVGVVVMKNNQAFEELKKELEREKHRNPPSGVA